MILPTMRGLGSAVEKGPSRASDELDGKRIYVRVLSAGTHRDKAMKSRRHAQSEVWWRRRELNPGPKTFRTTDLHVWAIVLVSQPPTPTGWLRLATSPVLSRPQPLSTSFGPARCIALRPPPRASGGGTSQLFKLRVQILGLQLHFPGGFTRPRELDMHR